MKYPTSSEKSPDTSSENSAPRELILEAGRGERNYWADLWTFRELFGILAWRDVVVQYKQTVIGMAWAILRPLLTMIVFTLIFGRLAKLPSEGSTPYPIMVMTGMLAWFLISTILNQSSNSLIQNQNLVSKVYFPRIIVPAASAVVALVDFSITFSLLLLMMIVYGFYPDWRILLLPLLIVFAVATALGPALLLASFNIKYRDFRFILPFLIQFGLYVSPVGFSSTVIPEEWRLLYSLNPAVAVIDGFRWCLLGGASPLYLPGFLIGVSITLLFLVIGIRAFRATEKTFADLI